MCMYASQKRQMLQRRGGTFGILDKTKCFNVSSYSVQGNFDLSVSDLRIFVVYFSFVCYDGFQLSEQMFH